MPDKHVKSRVLTACEVHSSVGIETSIYLESGSGMGVRRIYERTHLRKISSGVVEVLGECMRSYADITEKISSAHLRKTRNKPGGLLAGLIIT